MSLIDDAHGASAAMRAPGAPSPAAVSNGFIIRYFIGFIGVYLVLMTPAAMTLAVRVGQIAPDSKASALGTIIGIGAFMALLANPIFGRLSDMTRSRFGRRKPWLVIGMVGGTLATAVIAQTESLFVIGLCWAVAQALYNAALAAIIAVVPDSVPEHQRGRISALSGMSLYIALLLGSYIFSITGSGAVIFMGPALLGLAGVLLFVAFYKERPTDRDPAPGPLLKGLLAAFWVNPRQAPDFAWAWISRFMVLFGFAVLITYQVYFVSDVLGATEAEVGGIMFNSMLITAIFVVASSYVAGWASDRMKQRKLFVVASAVLYALGIAVLIVAGSITMFYVSIAMAAVGFGVYLAVDQALVVDILPNRETDAGKDLGVFNIANAVPQALAPALAPMVLAMGGYGLLYTVAALAAFLGAVFVLPVRGVR